MVPRSDFKAETQPLMDDKYKESSCHDFVGLIFNERSHELLTVSMVTRDVPESFAKRLRHSKPYITNICIRVRAISYANIALSW